MTVSAEQKLAVTTRIGVGAVGCFMQEAGRRRPTTATSAQAPTPPPRHRRLRCARNPQQSIAGRQRRCNGKHAMRRTFKSSRDWALYGHR